MEKHLPGELLSVHACHAISTFQACSLLDTSSVPVFILGSRPCSLQLLQDSLLFDFPPTCLPCSNTMTQLDRQFFSIIFMMKWPPISFLISGILSMEHRDIHHLLDLPACLRSFISGHILLPCALMPMNS